MKNYRVYIYVDGKYYNANIEAQSFNDVVGRVNANYDYKAKIVSITDKDLYDEALAIIVNTLPLK